MVHYAGGVSSEIYDPRGREELRPDKELQLGDNAPVISLHCKDVTPIPQHDTVTQPVQDWLSDLPEWRPPGKLTMSNESTDGIKIRSAAVEPRHELQGSVESDLGDRSEVCRSNPILELQQTLGLTRS